MLVAGRMSLFKHPVETSSYLWVFKMQKTYVRDKLSLSFFLLCPVSHIVQCATLLIKLVRL